MYTNGTLIHGLLLKLPTYMAYIDNTNKIISMI